ncbi:AAEL017541-PA [Aedes aegypti]|uniref:AAEL017541-PA n=1 Tax=Aedes aegypti TaxID=7159 RepID=J9HIG7_AEDAE|nr:AAEL017541-PA [Aedes aegypti]
MLRKTRNEPILLNISKAFYSYSFIFYFLLSTRNEFIFFLPYV